MHQYILDSSALLAMINNEPGGKSVFPLCEMAVISSVNACEVMTKLHLKGLSYSEAGSVLKDSGVQITLFDAELAGLTAAIIAITKPFGLSLGDRACLATAQHLGLEAVTADRAWVKLDLPVKITVIR